MGTLAGQGAPEVTRSGQGGQSQEPKEMWCREKKQASGRGQTETWTKKRRQEVRETARGKSERDSTERIQTKALRHKGS